MTENITVTRPKLRNQLGNTGKEKISGDKIHCKKNYKKNRSYKKQKWMSRTSTK